MGKHMPFSIRILSHLCNSLASKSEKCLKKPKNNYRTLPTYRNSK